MTSETRRSCVFWSLAIVLLNVAIIAAADPVRPKSDADVSTESYLQWWMKYSSEDQLRGMLRQAPELNLTIMVDGAGKEALAQLQQLVNGIETKNRQSEDRFVRELPAVRRDLAGLPFRVGDAARLDLRWAPEREEHSRDVRAALDDTERQLPHETRQAMFWANVTARRSQAKKWNAAAAERTFVQVLAAEEVPLRRSLVALLRASAEVEATAALARFALFDLNANVRDDAIEALKQRPSADYLQVLRDGFRYPWVPVAHHAARATILLRARAIVPELVELLDEPDPDAPFESSSGTHKVWMRHELVAVNHHKNCLLCHAPAAQTDSFRAAVPIPGERLRPVYSSSSTIQVRADVTYLKQDFSALQPVADAEPWPERQRFDYLVRTRPLTPEEVLKHQRGPRGLSEHRQIIHMTLRKLTYHDAEPSAAAWRAALRLEPRWTSPCLK